MLGITLWPLMINYSGLRSRRSDGRRQRYSDGLRHFPAATISAAAHRDCLATVFDRHLLQGFDVPFDVFPFESLTSQVQSLLQFLAQNQRQERTKHMAADCLIALMKNRPRLKHRFHITKDPFEHQKLGTIGNVDKTGENCMFESLRVETFRWKV